MEVHPPPGRTERSQPLTGLPSFHDWLKTGRDSAGDLQGAAGAELLLLKGPDSPPQSRLF